VTGRCPAFHASEPARADAHDAPGAEVALAAPGRIEGLTEVVNVNAGVDGVLASVAVHEGQHVDIGDVLATVHRDDLARELAAARAALESLKQVRVRLLRGSRPEAREQAAAETAARSAALLRARSRHERLRGLGELGIVAADALEEGRRDFEVAESLARAAARREDLVRAQPLPEEVAKADADVRAADERVRTAEARREQCIVRAPLAGTVLRCHLRAGEAVSTTVPQPILALVDVSRLRVRTEVDERHIGRVRPAQPVIVRAEAFGDRAFRGRVSRVASVMGRKNVHTGDPAEKSDRDVLEVMAEMDGTDEGLVVGLRVTVQFLAQ